VSFSNECRVGDVPPVHLMETYRGCVGVCALIISDYFIWICAVGSMHRFS
jgi:hypothetical protein